MANGSARFRSNLWEHLRHMLTNSRGQNWDHLSSPPRFTVGGGRGRGGGGGRAVGEGRGEAPSPRAPAPALPVRSGPHRAQQEGPRQHGRGPAGAGGITPRGNLLAKQKRMFQAGLCSFLMAVPWPGARRPQTHSAVSSRPVVLICSLTSKQGFS